MIYTKIPAEAFPLKEFSSFLFLISEIGTANLFIGVWTVFELFFWIVLRRSLCFELSSSTGLFLLLVFVFAILKQLSHSIFAEYFIQCYSSSQTISVIYYYVKRKTDSDFWTNNKFRHSTENTWISHRNEHSSVCCNLFVFCYLWLTHPKL